MDGVGAGYCELPVLLGDILTFAFCVPDLFAHFLVICRYIRFERAMPQIRRKKPSLCFAPAYTSTTSI